MNVTPIPCRSGNVIYRLEPSDGYKNVTDGNAICQFAIVGQDVDINRWHDTNNEPEIDDKAEEPSITENEEESE